MPIPKRPPLPKLPRAPIFLPPFPLPGPGGEPYFPDPNRLPRAPMPPKKRPVIRPLPPDWTSPSPPQPKRPPIEKPTVPQPIQVPRPPV